MVQGYGVVAAPLSTDTFTAASIGRKTRSASTLPKNLLLLFLVITLFKSLTESPITDVCMI